MTPAIRIIKASISSPPQILEAEREEQIIAVARRVAEASGYATQEKMDSCASKLRSIGDLINGQTPECLAQEISEQMVSPEGVKAFMAHAEMDISRIMELLEG